MKPTLSFITLTMLLLTGCKTNYDALYNKAVADAQNVRKARISHKLISINIPHTDSILVGKWVDNVSYYPVGIYNTKQRPQYVFIVSEFAKHASTKDTARGCLRIKQRLGLPPKPAKEYTHFVEFWVKTADIFRPCPDKYITDKQCDLVFPDDTDTLHIAFINEKRATSYSDPDLQKRYPWSQLGYTYDWSCKNLNHMGLSEFVIAKNREVRIDSTYTTLEYLKKVSQH